MRSGTNQRNQRTIRHTIFSLRHAAVSIYGNTKSDVSLQMVIVFYNVYNSDRPCVAEGNTAGAV